MDEEVLAAICDVIRKGEKAVLVSVIATRGSTPRKAGSKMLIYPDGRTIGTIGGGCGEAEVKIKALQALGEEKPGIHQVQMLDNVAANEGMVCGGIMEVFIQIVRR